MLLYVLHETGRREILTLVAPVAVIDGKRLDRLVGADGIEHFFTKDGYYDGWGCGVADVSPSDIDVLLDRTERARYIEPGISE